MHGKDVPPGPHSPSATPGDTHVAGPMPDKDLPDPAPVTAPDARPGAGPGAGPASGPVPGAVSDEGSDSAPDIGPGAGPPPAPASAPATGSGPDLDALPEQPEGVSPDETAPGSARPNAPQPARLLEDAEADRLRRRWHQVQSGFVDDPRDAVRKADELAAEAVNVLGKSLTSRKRTLDDGWRDEHGERPDTERLRLALRGYREFLDRLLTI